jgi:predicted glutamine amidotransferase
MCVIVTKPMNSPMPPDSAIESMWNSNPDGAGFAYALNNKVHVEKGFMTLKALQNGLAGLEKRLKSQVNMTLDEVALLVHFRITTHGGTSPELTHPFPITRDTAYMLSTDYKADVVIAHNGIISTVPVTAQNSDTTQYIRDILVPMKNSNRRFMENKHMLEIIEKTINSSRFTFLDKDGNFHFVGNWQTDPDTPGCSYSNLYHKSYKPSKYETYNNGFNDYSLYGNPVRAKKLPDTAMLIVGKHSGWPMYEPVGNAMYDFYITEDDNIISTDAGELDLAWYEFHYDGVVINNEEVTFEDIPAFAQVIYVDDELGFGWDYPAPTVPREADIQDNASSWVVPQVPKP